MHFAVILFIAAIVLFTYPILLVPLLIIAFVGYQYLKSAVDNSTYIAVPDESLKYEKTKKLVSDFITLDFETTGLDHTVERIVEIGAIKFVQGEQVDTFHTFVNPEMAIPSSATKIHGITNDMVAEAKTIDEILPELINFLGDNIIVAHNAPFDLKFMLTSIYAYNERHSDKPITFAPTVADTLSLSRSFIPESSNHKLVTLKKLLGLNNKKSHSAFDDSFVTGKLYLECKRRYEEKNQYEIMVNTNKKGSTLEKEGRIDEAIAIYEKNISNNFDGNHPYDRLAIIYRKRKQYDDEIRVLNHAIYVFEKLVHPERKDRLTKLEKFKERLAKVEAKLQ